MNHPYIMNNSTKLVYDLTLDIHFGPRVQGGSGPLFLQNHGYPYGQLHLLQGLDLASIATMQSVTSPLRPPQLQQEGRGVISCCL